MIGTELHTQVEALETHAPAVHRLVDPARVARQAGREAGRARPADAFGAASGGGRGESYIAAQRALHTRRHGITQLLDLLTADHPAPSPVVLDLLGGDGLVAKVVAEWDEPRPTIVTCDASPFMVEAAWADGVPALRQRAEEMLFRDASVDGVLLAYGSHHLSREQRGAAAREAFRVLGAGGAFVLHDFLTGSPMDTWFAKVVDAYSRTGHDHEHFDRAETEGYLRDAGFADVRLTLLDDPFVATGASRREAELALGAYLVNMYGLVELVAEHGERTAHARAFELAADIFRYERPDGGTWEIRTVPDEERGTWTTTMPREALVAVGRRP
ncbi:Ubiquinone/menaquinone biosynthesis C-methylase UbiE [Streptomyces zhaozhouensis]|uniref:Ubiquinone/menaquinone biosynthesis C-methylase UbiE n=1 Tax=Streptomyces zhaozhouensis TaxID=1300267 RepID=A0A286DLJ4_9ACTN|nr:methyltransferase domain-containing protein [Streptomyces zhaozhouensis]SOD59509.1 Ubiquinone/menaquinone biosynthesis C-methylase UbiE [Streptomyces zhaozhouensis]